MSNSAARRVYITGVGAYLPGEPIGNDRIEERLGCLGGKPSRSKHRILMSNGIRYRHYALDEKQRTTELNEELAAKAVQAALADRGLDLNDVDMLALGTSQGDTLVPGFASMVQGRLHARPMELLSAGGVCCSSMAAFQAAVRALALGHHRVAVAGGSELASRSLKASRFETEPTTEDTTGGERGAVEDRGSADSAKSYRDFDAEFLRWMLSDGAGAVVLESQPRPDGLSLHVDWIEITSHAGELPTCMYMGLAEKESPRAGRSWLDYPTVSLADRDGIMRVRQDTRILHHIVRLGLEKWCQLMQRDRLRPSELSHILVHYSSDFFRGQMFAQMAEAGVCPPQEKFWSNLEDRGNTGAASIWIMLWEAMKTGRIKRGDRVLLMVPESGRFTVSFAQLTCVAPGDEAPAEQAPVAQHRRAPMPVQHQPAARDRVTAESASVASPLGDLRTALDSDDVVPQMVIELSLVWADFERRLRTVPLVARIEDGTITIEDYRRLLVNLRQQVVEGGRWIARAASNMSIERFDLRSLFIGHAQDEHRDYQMIERDFCAVGGTLDEITRQPKNIGSEALSSFMFHHASQPDPLDLIGAMFIIEGLGTARARAWADSLQATLGLADDQVSFLRYHGQNDDSHFEKLRGILRSGVIDRDIAARIVTTAKVTGRLYALQLEEIDNV